jgi:transcription elongation factor Elf1
MAGLGLNKRWWSIKMNKYEKKYLKSKATRCPVCNSQNIASSTPEPVDCDGYTSMVQCLDCDSSWVEQYKLVGITDLEVDKCGSE